ncbi:MAG: GntR family transcriptional regulator [Intestinibacter sp.]|uniref:GntR family transcriptional regulator n=1 Tax=Intestinibacter sp. TaxID=1965304 RepID=UPI0025C1CFA5|nr:GntR family transcriptional regulator [Intestinibacter sp.]MCI6738771.1 GntR family transcriptional regulator [Intestinibacter sp.]
MIEMKPLQLKAYDYIKDLILTHQLRDDEIYSETKIAKELGISRTPLRDAIHHLVEEGYIDIIPSKGFKLHKMTKQDVLDTFQIRSAIEGYCTFYITENYKTEECQQLFSYLEYLLFKQEQILNSSKSIEEFTPFDNKFHIEIVHHLKNQSFNKLFDMQLYRIKALATSSLSHVGRMEDTLKEHKKIFNAMTSGDVENIYKITMEHMQNPLYINLEDLSSIE